jgi:molybdopterin molybdotransferase
MALDKILHIHPLGIEKVSLSDVLGRVIAEDIYARRNIPPLNNSGMDGYALRFEDIQKASAKAPVRLEVIEDLPAGFISKKKLERGQAIRIMTGAPIPEGANTVIPVEETKKEEGSVLIFNAGALDENIRKSGEDVRKGECVISRGDTIRPAEVGMLASVGRSFVSVYQRPLVAILCTGDELVDVDGELDDVRIISSNSYTLAAQVKECGRFRSIRHCQGSKRGD